MTTATTTTVLDHSNDAGFRTWVAEIITQLVLCGAVQTADTGQIDTATVTRPGTNTTGGYAILRTPDSSLYFKFEFGTGNAATLPRMLVTVGSGSNGTGTITGQTNTASNIFTAVNVTSAAVPYISRFCVKNGYLAFIWKEAAQATNPQGLIIVGRTVDSSGAITTTGFSVARIDSNSNRFAFQSVRTASPASTGAETNANVSSAITCIAGAVTSSLDSSGNNQAYLFWGAYKDVQPFFWACAVLSAEVGLGATFSVALIGATAHTYIGLPSTALMSAVGNAVYPTAMMWE